MTTSTTGERRIPPADETRRRWDRRAQVLILGAALLSVVLGAVRLSRKSFWYDETFSGMATRGGWRTVWSTLVHNDANMSLYVALLHVWRLVGSSDGALRSLSVFAMAGSVVVVALVARRLFGTRTALIAAVLLALAPFAVRYSQEARSYGLLVLLTLLSSLLFVALVERGGGPTRALLYALVGAAACYAHLFGILVLVAHGVSVPFLGRQNTPRRSLALAWAVMAVLLVPLAVLVLSVGGGGIKWIPHEGLRGTLHEVLAPVAGGRPLGMVLSVLAVVAIAAGCRALISLHPSLELWRIAFPVCWLVVPVVSAVVISAAVQPVLVARYLIVILPPLVILASAGIDRLPRPLASGAALALCVALSLNGVVDWYRARPQEDWRSLVAFVVGSAQRGDEVMFCVPEGRTAFEYYALRFAPGTLPGPLSPAAPWDYDAVGRLFQEPAGLDVVRRLRGQAGRIWVVHLYESAGRPVPACRLPESLAGFRSAMTRNFRGITLELLDSPR